MKHIGFILENNFQMMGIAPMSAFEFANQELGREAYRITVMSEKGGAVTSSLGVTIQTIKLTEFPDTLMIVGAIYPQASSAELRDYLKRAGERSRRIAGLCTGAFALAEAGLLAGRSATTHWAHARKLQTKFPQIKVDEDRIYIADGIIWTSAGMTAAIDLALALIEEDHGAALSRSIARKLVVYYRRPGGQSQFSALMELEPSSDRIRRVLIYAKEHLRNRLSIEELAEVANISPRQFSRIFRDETGQSPAKGIEKLRLEAAKLMLEEGNLSIDKVSRDTGFGDRNRMRRAFIRAYGHPPQSLRRTLKYIDG